MNINVLSIFDPEKVDIPTALLISVISIAIVFVILILIIAISHFVFKGIDKVDDTININPKRKENAILKEDKDAQIALIVATIDFNKETGKNAKLNKIERID